MLWRWLSCSHRLFRLGLGGQHAGVFLAELRAVDRHVFPHAGGMAFANAPVGAVHALAYPIGGQFHVPHGLSNALVLLPVLEFNLSEADAMYAELADAVRATERTWHRSASGRAFIDAMATIVGELGLERTLGELGVIEADLPGLATDAMKVQRLLVNNPRDVSYEQALALYREAL